MKTCPNCGSSNADNMNFCNNCGSNIKDVAPASEQPVQASSFAQVEEKPVQPTYVEPTPVVAKPIQNQPSYDLDREFENTQPKGSNGLCVAGFIVSLISILTVGTTAIISLILSICGLVSASKKGNKKGLGIAGLIISIILTLIGCFFIVSVSQTVLDEMDNVKSHSSKYEDEDDEDDDEDEDDEDDEDDDSSKKNDGTYSSSAIKKDIKGASWIEKNEGSLLDLKSGSFKYYKDHDVLDDYYYEGDYELYVGDDAIEYVTVDLSEYDVTEDEINDLCDRNEKYDESNFMVLVLKNEKCIVDGENTFDETVVTPYFGFYLNDGDTVVLDIANMKTGTYYWFIPEADYQG